MGDDRFVAVKTLERQEMEEKIIFFHLLIELEHFKWNFVTRLFAPLSCNRIENLYQWPMEHNRTGILFDFTLYPCAFAMQVLNKYPILLSGYILTLKF